MGRRHERAAARLEAERAWRRVAGEQAGVIGRGQLLDLDLTPGSIDARLDSGRWRRLHPGVYATFTGPVPEASRLWAAVLACGTGAALAGRSALWLWGVGDRPPTVEVDVPDERKVVAPSGVVVVRRRRLGDLVHPVARPSRVRLEEAVVDVTARCGTVAEVMDVVLRATSSRRTTPARLRSALAARRAHPHRRLLEEVLGEAAEGVQTALEHRYRRGVERAHGLPRGVRNEREVVTGRTGAPRSRYRDVRYRRWGIVVELDGLEAHPAWLRRLDRARDNSVSVAGDHSLEYGWAEVVGDPCSVAVDVVRSLWREGWRGIPAVAPRSAPSPRCSPRKPREAERLVPDRSIYLTSGYSPCGAGGRSS